MSLSVEVLNTIRNTADTEYATRIPEATRNNITAIGRAFQTYSVQFNQFIDSLIHKIGMTIVQTKTYENKLKPFKSGAIYSQQDIEEIWVDQFMTAKTYDAEGGMGTNGEHPFKRVDYSDVQVMYHRMNRQDRYKITISKIDLLRAFRSENVLNEFLAAQFNRMYTSANYDEYVHMKQIFAVAVGNNDFFKVDVPTIDGTTQSCMTFVRSVKKIVKDLSYVSDQFNPAKVKTFSNPNELVLFVHKDVAAHMDVDMYAQIFGPEYAKLGVKVVEVDNFGSATDVYALLVDKDWFKVYDTLRTMEELNNGEGLYKNYWLHIWQILSYSKFKNAVCFGPKKTA